MKEGNKNLDLPAYDVTAPKERWMNRWTGCSVGCKTAGQVSDNEISFSVREEGKRLALTSQGKKRGSPNGGKTTYRPRGATWVFKKQGGSLGFELSNPLWERTLP